MLFEFNHFQVILTHSFPIISTNAIIMNKKKTGETLSSCFNPISKGMDMSMFPIINLTLLSVYILLLSEHNLGGAAVFI